MATKEKKTEAELRALIMDAIRQHPEFSNIINVVITRPPQEVQTIRIGDLHGA
jgi:hypothetical protein